MRFTNCRFVSTRNYLLLAQPATPDTASRFWVQGCTFELDNAEPPLGGADQLAGVVFSGSTAFSNGPHRADSLPRNIVLGRAGVSRSAEVVAQGRLQLLAPACRYQLPAGLAVGRAGSVVVGAGSTLVLSEQAGEVPEVYIGPGARLVVQKGGTLELQPHTKVTIAGQLVIEKGAYLHQAPLAEMQTTGRGRVQRSLSQP